MCSVVQGTLGTVHLILYILKGGDKLSELFTTSRAAQILDISTQTLKRWYKWYHSDDYQKPIGLKLPEPEISGNGTMLFTMEQIQELHKFQTELRTIYRGAMAEFNAVYQWGRKGTKILNVGKQYKKKKKEGGKQ